jgi:DNA-binding transcriptional ArsR family regulator
MVYNAVMDAFSALAEPTRRSIIEMLARQGRLSASDISARFPVSAPAISQHLKVLREARLVRVEKQAQRRIYEINPDAMIELEQWARKMRELWDERFDALDRVLEAEKQKALANQQDASSFKEGRNG